MNHLPFPDSPKNSRPKSLNQGQLRLQNRPLTFGGQSTRFLIFKGYSMLWTIFAILIILWLLGWGFHVAGGLIHLLLVVALVVAVINLVTGRRTV
jgi:Family of unknown function (DUF5670)